MCILMKEANVKRLCKNYCIIPIIRHFGKGKVIETVKRSVVIGCLVGTEISAGDFKAVKPFCMIL